MRVIMTGGGTGGHIYPAIAIADKIREKHPDAEILYIGTEGGMEKALAPQSGYSIRFVTASGLNRKKILKNAKVLADFMKGMKEAKAIIGEFKPDIVIGTGGYVCLPVIKAASRLGVKVFIHEQNAFPGLANKLLEKNAEKVFLGFKEAADGFKKKDKLVFTGNPVRKEFFSDDKNGAREKLGVPEGEFMIVSFGGSRGAARINDVMIEVAAAFSGADGVSVCFATGRINYDGAAEKLRERIKDIKPNIRILPYLDEADKYMAACDVVISRAGALTVSEIAACQKQAILIPSPNVTGNHQFFNAKTLSDAGRAILIEEKDLDAEELIAILNKMRENNSLTAKMGAAPFASAVEIIYENLCISG